MIMYYLIREEKYGPDTVIRTDNVYDNLRYWPQFARLSGTFRIAAQEMNP